MDNLDKLHGDTFNVAYHIGEDLCEGGNILISSKVKNRLSNQPNFENSTFTLYDNQEDNEEYYKIFEISGAKNP